MGLIQTIRERRGIALMVFGFAAIAGYIGIQSDGERSVTPLSTNEHVTPTGYRSIAEEEIAAELDVPEGARVDSPAPGQVRVTFFGSGDQPDTELQEGFQMYIHRNDELTSTTSLRAYAEQELRAVTDQQLIVTERLNETRVGERTAYRFSHETQLGNNTTKYIFLSELGTGYVVGYSIIGTDPGIYMSMVNTMLASLKFTAVAIEDAN